MFRFIYILLFFIIQLIGSLSNLYGATVTWEGNTNSDWDVLSNWDTAVPVNGDDVIIATIVNQPSLNVDTANLNSLVIQAGHTLTTNNFTLTVTGPVSGGGTLNGGTGDVNISGNVTITNFTASSGTTTIGGGFGPGFFTAAGGSVVFNNITNLGGVYTFNDIEITGSLNTFNNNLDVNGNITGTGSLSVQLLGAQEIITVDGNFEITNYSHNGGILTFAGAGAQSFNCTSNMGSVIVNKGNTLTANSNMNGVSLLTMTGGTLDIATGNTLSLTGAPALNGGTLSMIGTAGLSAAGQVFTVSGTTVTHGTGVFQSGAFTVNSGSFTQTGNNGGNANSISSLTVGGGACSWDSGNAGGTLILAGAVSHTNGSIDFGNKTVTGVTTFSMSNPGGNMDLGGSDITASGNVTISSAGAGTFIPGTSILRMAGGNLSSDANLNTVVVQGNGSLSSNITLNGNLTVNTGITLNMTTFNLTVGGTLSTLGTGTVSASSGDLSVTGITTNNGTIVSTLAGGTQSYTGAVTSPGVITGAGGLIDFNNNVNFAGGTINQNTSAINAAGNFTGATFNSGAGILTFDGAGAQSFNCTSNMGSVIVNKGNTLTANSNMNGVSLLTMTGGTFNISTGNTLTLTGPPALNGGTLSMSGTAGLSAAGVVVTVAGTAVTHGTGVFQSGAFTVSSGSFTQSGINGGANSITSLTVSGGVCSWDSGNAGGTLTLAGVVSHTNGSVDFGNKTVTGVTTFAMSNPGGNMDLGGSDITASGNVTISSAGAGTFIPGTSILRMAGGNLSSDANLNTVVVQGNGSLSSNITLNGNLTVNTGITLNMTTFNLTVGGTLSTLGTGTVSASSGDLSVTGITTNNGTIVSTLAGGTQSYTGAVTSPGVITGAGGLIDFNNNVNFAGGTINQNTSAINAAGNFTGATFNSGAGILTFDGAGAQSFNCTSNMGSVIVNKGNTLTANSNMNGVSLLTMTGGTFNISTGNTLTLTGPPALNGGTLSMSGTAGLSAAGVVVTVAGTAVTHGTGVFQSGAFTVSSGSFTQSGINGGANSITSLTVSGGVCSWDSGNAGGTLTLAGVVSHTNGSVDFGNKTVTGVTTFAMSNPGGNMDLGGSDITASGNVTISSAGAGTFIPGTSILRMAGGNLSSDANLNTVVVQGNGSLSSNITLNGNLTVNTGITLNMTTFNLTVGGTLSTLGTGTVSASSGDLSVTGITTNNGTIVSTLAGGTQSYTGAVTSPGVITGAGGLIDFNNNVDFTLGTINQNTSAINTAGNFTGGTFITGAGILTFDGAGAQSFNCTSNMGSVIVNKGNTLTANSNMNGVSLLTMTGGTFNISTGNTLTLTGPPALNGGTLSMSGTAGLSAAGVVVTVAGTAVTHGTGVFQSGAFTVSSGSFTQSGINGGANSITSLTVSGGVCSWDSGNAGGTLTLAGVVSHTNGSVDFGNKTVTGVTTFAMSNPGGNMDLGGSDITASGNVTISSAGAGTFIPGTSILRMAGGNLSSDANLNTVVVQGNGSLSSNITLNGNLTVNTGITLNMTTFNLTVGGTLSTLGTGTVSASSGDLSVTGITTNNGTIVSTLAGGTQSYTGAVTSPGVITGAGGLIDFNNSVNFAGGTINQNTSAINTAGNFTGGTFITGAGILTFDGAGAQSFNCTSNMGSVTVNSGGTVTANSNMNGVSLLTMTGGTLDIATGNTLSLTGAPALNGGTLSMIGTAGLSAAGQVFTVSGTTVTHGTGVFQSGAFTVNSGSFTQTGNNGGNANSISSLTVGGGACSWDLGNAGGTLTITNDVIQLAGTLSFGTKTISCSNVNITGGDITLGSSVLTASGAANVINTAGTITDTASSLTLTGGGTLTLDGNERIGDLVIASNVTLSSSPSVTDVDTLTVNAGNTFTCAGNDLRTAGLSTVNGNISFTTGDFYSGGNLVVGGAGSSVISGAGFYTVDGTTTNGGTIRTGTSGTASTFTGAVTNTGIFDFQTNSSNAVNFSAALNNNGGTVNSGNSPFTVTGAVNNSGNINVNGTGLVTFSNTYGAVTSTGTVTMGSTGNILFTGNATFSGGNLTGNAAGGVNPVIEFQGNAVMGTFTHNSDSVLFSGALAQTLNTNGQAFFNIEVNKTAGTVAQIVNNLQVDNAFTNTAGGYDVNDLAMTVTGNVSIAGGTFTAGTGTVSCGGNWTAAAGAVFNSETGTVVFNGGGAQALVTGGTDANHDFNSIQVNKGGGTLIQTTDGLQVNSNFTNTAGGYDVNDLAMTVTGNVSIAGGTFTAGTGTVSCGGNWTTAAGAVFNSETGTVVFNGGGAQALVTGGTDANHDFNNIQVNKGGGTLTQTTDGLQVNSNFTNTAGGYDVNDLAMTVAGNVSIAGGTFTAGTGTVSCGGNWTTAVGAVFNSETGAVVFNGGGPQALVTGGTDANHDFNNIQVNKGGGTLTQTTNDLQVNSNFTNTAGGYDVNDLAMTVAGNVSIAGGTFTAGIGTVSCGGNWTTAVGAVFNSETGLVLFNGAGAQSLTTGGNDGNHDFYNIAVNKGGGTISVLVNDLTCRNFFHFDGTLNIAGRTVRTTGDFAAFGPGYASDDGGTVDVFKYDPSPAFTRSAAIDAASSFIFAIIPEGTVTDAVFANLDGATIRTDRNFYNNGADMPATVNWNLQVRDNRSAITFFAEAYGAITVTNSQVALNPLDGTIGNIAAAEGVAAPGCSPQWRTARTAIAGAGTYTVYDDVIRVEFDELIENTNDEISAAVADIFLTAYATPFTGTYTDAECTTSTDTVGDIDTFYIRITTNPWNTDAQNASLGNASSTDRDGTHQTNIPQIHFRKHLAGLYQTLRDQYKNRLDTTNYITVTDKCSPILVSVTAARDPGTAQAYNYHNYFQLKYSEPVNLGSVAGFTIADATAANTRANTVFDDGANWGSILQNGANVDITGLFSYAASTVNKGSRDATPEINSLYRANTGGAANSESTHGIRIFIAGYSTGAHPDQVYPGYVWGVTSPLTRAVTVPANNFITDASGNILEHTAGSTYPKIAVSVTGAGWDVDQPVISAYSPGAITGPYNEILTRDTDTDNLIDRLELHIHDNSADDGTWDSTADHPDPTAGEGLRDTSVTSSSTGFTINSTGNTTVRPASGFSFLTAVENSLFKPTLPYQINVKNDMYFSISFNDSELPLNYLTQLILSYDSSIGLITDLSGNLLYAETNINCYEQVPPSFTYTLSIVGDDKIFVKFSEYVYGQINPPHATTDPIDSADFTIAGYTISGIDRREVAPDSIGTLTAFINLDSAITANDAISLSVTPFDGASVFDSLGTPMDAAESHRITDVGIGIIEPVWADDSIESEDIQIGGTLKYFDGTGKLHDSDITLEANILASNAAGFPVNIFYDANVPSSYYWNDLWLPALIPGFNPAGNTSARGSAAYSSSGTLRSFNIPENDSEMTAGTRVDFIFRVGDLFCARVADPEDPRTVVPWSVKIEGVKEQRSGVTILNNVINPLKGEKTVLTYDLKKRGGVTINIFSLSGDVVKTLYKGTQPAGSYSFTWDGKNSGGRVVARGIYFIRVVGPGISEYRKVLVVK